MKPIAILFALALALAQPITATPGTGESSSVVQPVWSPTTARQHRAVTSHDFDWHDERRNRDVPVRIWHPVSMDAPCPVMIFSHGLGGTRTGYEYLGRFLAENGYIVILPQHVGSDDSVWRGKARPMQEMKKAAKDLSEIMARPEDISFVIDQTEKLNSEDARFKDHLDLKRIAVGGHSFGAYTALAAAGRQLIAPLGGQAVDLSDPRIKACVALSPPASSRELTNGSYSKFQIPCLHMTGTLDSSPINGATADLRRVPYDAIQRGDQYLITLNGGDHMVFSGRRTEEAEQGGSGTVKSKIAESMRQREGSGMNGDPANDAKFQRLIEDAILGFLQAHLEGNADAKARMTTGGLEAELGKDATLEKK